MDAALDRPLLLAGLLRRLGDFSIRTFEDRLVLQKTVYLLQTFGIYLGYQFNWYLHGPYSPQLTRDAFGLQTDWSAYKQVFFANPAVDDRIKEFLTFVARHKNDPLWLETIASAHFLARVHREKDSDAIHRKIHAKQPRVTRTLFDDCWNKLLETNLL